MRAAADTADEASAAAAMGPVRARMLCAAVWRRASGVLPAGALCRAWTFCCACLHCDQKAADACICRMDTGRSAALTPGGPRCCRSAGVCSNSFHASVHDSRCRGSPTEVRVSVAHQGSPVNLCRPSMASTAALVVGHRFSGKGTAGCASSVIPGCHSGPSLIISHVGLLWCGLTAGALCLHACVVRLKTHKAFQCVTYDWDGACNEQMRCTLLLDAGGTEASLT